MADGVNCTCSFFRGFIPSSAFLWNGDGHEGAGPGDGLADFFEFLRLKICQVRLILLLQTAEAGRLVEGRGSDRSCTGGGRTDISHS